MDSLPSTDARAPQGRPALSALRRSQRRLLFGGGGLISLLIVLTLVFAAIAETNDFHAAQRQAFVEARSSVDYFLFQRDRAYATSINGNDAMWSGQRAYLQQQGVPLTERFLRADGELLVRAEGPTAVPWLVLGRQGRPLDRPLLEAYLGMMVEYSAYTTAAISALRVPGTLTMYAYEPQGRLLAVAGVADEAQLLRALRVATREEAFARLLAAEQLVQGVRVTPGPVQSATASGRVVSRFDANPISGQPSLVGVQTLADGRTAYFRRVLFEPVEGIRSRLDGRESGAFAVITRDGRTVLRTAAMARDVAPQLAARVASAEGAAGGDGRFYLDGHFAVHGPLAGVDWSLIHLYGWGDLWRDKGGRLLAQALAALTILAALWLLLLRMDRRVFAPALADASRVYESEALSRVIIDTSPVGLVLMDPHSGQPLVENELARQLAGNPGTIGGPGLYALLAEHARQQEEASVQEFQWLAAEEGDAPVRLQVSMALAAWRERTVWVCALRDVTAQAELEQTLRHARRDAELAREAAESASRAKTAFVATMSHEIRTPLNGVLGHLELLARSPMQDAQRERLERIRLSADALMDIISDVLDFSKIEAGQLDIDPVRFTPRPLIEQAALLYSAQAQRKGVKLYYAIEPALEHAFVGDVHRIRQILNNLVSNAVKFTESGRIVIRAALLERPRPAAPLLRLQIVDSGIGLDEAQLAQLFQPFQQADASISRRYGGSGLGLALCQQLARLLGGSIRVESTLGVGSVFSLDVPVQPVHDDVAPAEPPLRGRHVTLLSASAEWRSEIAQLLTRRGAEVTVIEQPEQFDGAAQDATALLFGERRAWSVEDEDAWLARHGRVVRAHVGGPLSPEQRADGVHVNCYASDALVLALGGPRLVPAAVDAAPTPPRGTRGRVLLVEDNPVNRELIQQQLEELGFAVDTAENGREALSVWQEGVHLAVLTDINMPVMDGYQLARALRERSTGLPILAVTATALASERERCREAGITDLLLKPMNLQALSSALQRYLGPPVANAVPEATPPAATRAAPDMPEKLRRVFVGSSRDDLARVRVAWQDEDMQTLLDRMHALKGVLMMIGEHDLGRRCGAMESALRESTLPPAAVLRQLLADLDALVDGHAAMLPS